MIRAPARHGPDPDGERTAAALRRAGASAGGAIAGSRCSRMPPLGSVRGALVMTSANAALAVGRHPRRAELTPAGILRSDGVPRTLPRRGPAMSRRRTGTWAIVRLIGALPPAPAPLLYLAGRIAPAISQATLPLPACALRRSWSIARRGNRLPGIGAGGASRQRPTACCIFAPRRRGYRCAQTAGVLDRALAPLHYCHRGRWRSRRGRRWKCEDHAPAQEAALIIWCCAKMTSHRARTPRDAT